MPMPCRSGWSGAGQVASMGAGWRRRCLGMLPPPRLEIHSPLSFFREYFAICLAKPNILLHFPIVVSYLCINQNQKNQPNVVLYLVWRSKIFLSVATSQGGRVAGGGGGLNRGRTGRGGARWRSKGHEVSMESMLNPVRNKLVQEKRYCAVLVLRMAHRKWRETKQQPSLLPGLAVFWCCLVSIHFLLAILSTSTVQRCPRRLVLVILNLADDSCNLWHVIWPSL